MIEINYFDQQKIMDRQGHTCSPITFKHSKLSLTSENNAALIFGGFGFDCNISVNENLSSSYNKKTNNRRRRLNDLILYSADSNTFQNIKCFGDLPKPRERHSAIICNTNSSKQIKLIIFGGRSNPKTYFNDVHILDCEKWEQSVKKHGKQGFYNEQPSPRCRHTATYIAEQKSMLVFGGKSYPNLQSNSDIWVYDINKFCQKKIKINDEIDISPSPRHSHASVLLDKRLYVYGGLCGSEQLFDTSLYILDTTIQKQQKIEINGTKEIMNETVLNSPLPRYSHSLVLMPKRFPNSIVLIGGAGLQLADYTYVQIYDILQNKQSNLGCLKEETCKLLKRNECIKNKQNYFISIRHSCAVLKQDRNDENCIYVFGGGAICFAFGLMSNNSFLISFS